MSELATCPICGAKILPSVVPMYDDGLDASTASCFNGKCLYRVRREDHNTLARRAEIGRIVERIVESENMLDVYRATLGDAPLFTIHTHGETARGATLLDALRALAVEIGGER